MFNHYRTEGVILKKIDRGEADQLLVVYTKEFGRVEIVAKSVRKSVSKLRPAIEFDAVAELKFIQGKTCKTLTDAVILIPLKHSRRDARKWKAMRRFSALTEALIKDQQEDLAVWELIRSALISIDGVGAKNLDAAYHHYVWHLFTLLGWRPGFGSVSAGAEFRSLVDFFRDSDIGSSLKMRLTGRQNEALEEMAQDYLQLITK